MAYRSNQGERNMAYQGRYVYGNAAPAYIPSPERRTERERRQNPQTRPVSVPKEKIDKVAVVLSLATILVTFFVCLTYVQGQFEKTYLSKNVVALESEIIELEKQNNEASELIEDSVDLTNVYQRATKEFGMVQAKNNQVFTYKSQKSDQIRQHGNIPS